MTIMTSDYIVETFNRNGLFNGASYTRASVYNDHHYHWEFFSTNGVIFFTLNYRCTGRRWWKRCKASAVQKIPFVVSTVINCAPSWKSFTFETYSCPSCVNTELENTAEFVSKIAIFLMVYLPSISSQTDWWI